MPNSTITITFSESALLTYSLIDTTANFRFTHNTSIDVIEEFVTSRVMPYQSSLVVGGTNRRNAFIDALNLDYPDLFTAVIDGVYDVIITSNFPNTIFETTIENDELTYTINNTTVTVPTQITVTGLESDRYLINNEININITADQNIVYFKTILTNLTNQQVSTNLITYPDSLNSADLGLQSIIKSLFNYPGDAEGYVVPDQIVPNSNKYKISVYFNEADVDGNPTTEVLGFETTKNFIRGGKRTTLTNQTIDAGLITPIDKLPVWRGYETAEYYIDGQNLIRKRILSDVSSSNIQEMRPKGCNQTYVKFLNQNGGYSNWLFESHANTENNTNQGGFIRDNVVDDLGNETDYKLQVSAKVPKAFIQLILDLIISPEIYATIDGVFVRVRSGRNSRTYDNIKRSYAVDINFEVDNRFNPSLLWSN